MGGPGKLTPGPAGFRYSLGMPSLTRLLPALVLIPVLTGLGGCLKRTITVTSTPPGAIVWINDVEVGRTPVQTDFNFFGTYDVRLRREGYEPIITSRKANAPLHEVPPLDLAAEAIPAKFETNIAWHFDLTPVPEADPAQDKMAVERALIARAAELRAAVPGPAPAPTPAPAPAPVEPEPAGAPAR
jgi:hypothetical protein